MMGESLMDASSGFGTVCSPSPAIKNHSSAICTAWEKAAAGSTPKPRQLLTAGLTGKK